MTAMDGKGRRSSREAASQQAVINQTARFPGAGNARATGEPGLPVTVGFIDPGKRASHPAADSGGGHGIPWMGVYSTHMFIILQYTAAHLHRVFILPDRRNGRWWNPFPCLG